MDKKIRNKAESFTDFLEKNEIGYFIFLADWDKETAMNLSNLYVDELEKTVKEAVDHQAQVLKKRLSKMPKIIKA